MASTLSPGDNTTPLQSPQVVQSISLDIPKDKPAIRRERSQSRPNKPGYSGHNLARGSNDTGVESVRKISRPSPNRAAAAEVRRRNRLLNNPRTQTGSARVTSYSVYQGRLVRENPSTQSLKKLLVHPILETHGSPLAQRRAAGGAGVLPDLVVEVPDGDGDGIDSPRTAGPFSARSIGMSSAANSSPQALDSSGEGMHTGPDDSQRGKPLPSIRRDTNQGEATTRSTNASERTQNLAKPLAHKQRPPAKKSGADPLNSTGRRKGRNKGTTLRGHQRYIEKLETAIHNALRPDPGNFKRVDVKTARERLTQLTEYVDKHRPELTKTMRGSAYCQDLQKLIVKSDKLIDSSTVYERLRPLIKHSSEAILHLNHVLDNRTAVTPTHVVLSAWKDANKSVNAMDRSYYSDFKSEVDVYRRKLHKATERCYMFSVHNLLNQKKHLESALRNQHMRINAELMLDDLRIMIEEEKPLLLARPGQKKDQVLDDDLKPTKGTTFYDEITTYARKVKSKVKLAAFNNQSHQDVGVVQSLARQVIYACKHDWEAEVRLRWVDLRVATKLFNDKGRELGWDPNHMKKTVDLVNEAKAAAFTLLPELAQDIATERDANELDIGREREKDRSGAESILPAKPVPGRINQAVTDSWRRIDSECVVGEENRAERIVDPGRKDWQTVRVYVTGNALDTNNEREYLRTVIFPELREMCLDRRIHLQEIDLRAGRHSEPPMSEKTINTFVEEIRRCSTDNHPFMVSICGEKHGDLIHKFQVAPDLRHLVPTDGLGLGTLETVVGAYLHKNPNAFFYFRDSSFIKDAEFLELPDVVQATQEDYREEQSKIDKMIGGYDTSANSLLVSKGKSVHVQKRVDSSLKFRLNTYKDHVRKRFGPTGQVYDNYSVEFDKIDYFFQKGQMRASVLLKGLETFGQRVKDDLWKAICTQYPLDRSGTKSEPILEDNSHKHRHFVQHVDEEALLFPDRLEPLITAMDEPGVVIISGDTGVGKSTVLAQLSSHVGEVNPDAANLVYFSGIGPEPFSFLNIFVQLCYQLQAALGMVDEPVPSGLQAASQYFEELLDEAGEMERVVYAFVTGLDAAGSPEDITHYLPATIPDHFHLVLSVAPDADFTSELRGYYPKCTLIPLPDLLVLDLTAVTRYFLFRRNTEEVSDDNSSTRPPSTVPIVNPRPPSSQPMRPPPGNRTGAGGSRGPTTPRSPRGNITVSTLPPVSEDAPANFGARPSSNQGRRSRPPSTTPGKRPMSSRRYSVIEECVDLELDDSMIDELMVRNKSRSILWARLAADEIYHCKYEHADDLATLSFIQALPPGIDDLVDITLERWEKAHGKTLLRHALSYLVLSRSGLLEAELHGLLMADKKLLPSPSEFLHLVMDLQPYLMPWEQASEGCMVFYHQAIAHAIWRRYLEDQSVVEKLRSNLSSYFHRLFRSRLGNSDDIEVECPRSVREAQYQDLVGVTAPNLQVAAVVRPFIPHDQDQSYCTVSMRGPQVVLTRERPYDAKLFTFDHTFWQHDEQSTPYSSEEDIITTMASSLCKAVEEREPMNVIGYGQTGSGKSRLLFGSESGPEGLTIGLTVKLFRALRQAEQAVADEADAAEPGIDGRLEKAQLIHNVKVSLLEVYGEKVRDLLATESEDDTNIRWLRVREHKKHGPYAEGARNVPVSSSDEVEVILRSGLEARFARATEFSPEASRSHVIFSIFIERVHIDPELGTESVTESKVNFVDLAGTEREKARKGNNDKQWNESVKIQRSLGSVVSCLSALHPVRPGKTAKPISYRDSVLTYLLKKSLTRDAKTVVLAMLRPDPTSYEENLAVLRKMNKVSVQR